MQSNQLPIKNVLWIEDTVDKEWAFQLPPVVFANDYRLELAGNVSEAIDKIDRIPFDLFIVDIRLPPGHHEYWQGLYLKMGIEDIKKSKLGFELIKCLTSFDTHNYPARKQHKKTYSISAFGIFSVDAENVGETELEKLNIQNKLLKEPGLHNTALLNLIKAVDDHNTNGH